MGAWEGMPIPSFESPTVRFLAFKDVRQKIESYGMEVYIEYLGGVQFEIKAGQHRVTNLLKTDGKTAGLHHPNS